ncbi:MAG TPA: NCS2 family permease [Ardenticatenaceae bacterium]
MADRAGRAMASTSTSPLESFFHLNERATTVRREVWAGLTTFMVMAYIIFVNPAILSFAGIPGLEGAGVPFNQALVATCLSAGLMTLLMGLFANRPFALAPGMGLNAVVAFQLILGAGLTWQEAMGVVVLEGLLVTVLVLVGLREAVMYAIPTALKHAIGAGIGFFILFIGLVNGGLVRVPVETVPIAESAAIGQPPTPLAIGALNNLPVFVTVIGLAITMLLYARRWRFALLAGIVITTVLAILLNEATGRTAAFAPGTAMLPSAIVGTPDFAALALPGLTGIPGIFLKLSVLTALLTIFSLMLTDFFDTMGTIIGVSEQMGDVGPNGEVENLRPMLMVDSAAAMVGGALGASSVTTYIESAGGVAVGGRTGLTSVVVAILFFLAMLFAPVAGVIPAQATAPALIIVGFLMASSLREIDWSDFAVGFPALLTVLLMPLTYSITHGIGFGFISYVLIKLFQGRSREIHWLMWASAFAFLLFFILPWLQQAMRS